MGQLRQYMCLKCGYAEGVCGGMDFGFEVVLVTITCHECRRLYDAVADQKAPDLGEEPDVDMTTGLACPKNQEHAFDLWEAGGPCPKCGAAMEAEGPELCWD